MGFFFSLAILSVCQTAVNHMRISILNYNKFMRFEKLLCAPPLSLCLLPQVIFTGCFFGGLFGVLFFFLFKHIFTKLRL